MSTILELSVKLQEVKDDLKEISQKVFEIDKNVIEQKIKFEQHAEHEAEYYQELKIISTTLLKNTQSLDEHIRRTSLLEEALEKTSQRVEPVEKDYYIRERFKQDMIMITKVIGALAAIVGIFGTIYAVFK